MVNITRRVSFSVTLALLLGWGAMSTMIIRSNDYLVTAETPNNQPLRLPASVRLTLLVDKQIYREGEPILLSLRNDSRMPIWLATNAGGCGESWWMIQRLGSDENDWRTVSRSKTACTLTSNGLEKITKGALKTDEWNGLLQTNSLGEVFLPAPTGTYRIAVPFLRGKDVVEGDWEIKSAIAATTAFTIQ